MSDPIEFASLKVVSYGMMVKVVWSAIVATFFVTMIIARFLFVEKELVVMSDRSDKRYARQQEVNKTVRDILLPLQVQITNKEE